MQSFFIDYIVPFAALGISASSAFYAFRKGRHDALMSVRPSLVFVYGRENGWNVLNVGNGPALNVVVGSSGNLPGIWVDPVRITPLKKDGSYHLAWHSHHGEAEFVVTYEDMWGQPYTTRFGKNRNDIRHGFRINPWLEEQIVAAWARIESLPTGANGRLTTMV